MIVPANVKYIKNYAFNGCSGLTDIYINSTTPPTLGNASTIPSTIEKIYVPAGSVDSYKSATYWSDYAEKIVAKASL